MAKQRLYIPKDNVVTCVKTAITQIYAYFINKDKHKFTV